MLGGSSKSAQLHSLRAMISAVIVLALLTLLVATEPDADGHDRPRD